MEENAIYIYEKTGSDSQNRPQVSISDDGGALGQVLIARNG